MYIFCELRSIFPSPAGARKNASNEHNVRSYYMLNNRIRGLLFHYKKKCDFAIGFYSVSVNVFIVELSKFCLFCLFSRSSSLKKSSPKDPNKSKLGSFPGSSSSAIIGRSSAGIRPVVNRLN